MTKSERFEIGCEFVLGDSSMGREPGLRQLSVALAGIDLHVSNSVFTIAVNDIFAVKYIVFVERIQRPKAIGIDSQRLLFAVRKQESNRRFIGGFRWQHVPVPWPRSARINKGGCPARTCPVRARIGHASATGRSRSRPFFPFDVQFVDFDRPLELWARRVHRS